MDTTLETLTSLVHGDVGFATTLMHHTRTAAHIAGVTLRAPRPMVPLAIADDGESLELPRHVLTDTFSPTTTAALAELKARLDNDPPPHNHELDDNPLQAAIVGPDPIPDSYEDLIAPPGEEGGPTWTMCPGKTWIDQRLSVEPDRIEPQLLPGIELFDAEHFTTVRHGARLMRVTGRTTRMVLSRIAQGEPLRHDIAVRASLARLASRGIVVAKPATPPAAPTQWATAGVSPALASIVQNTTTLKVAELDTTAAAVTSRITALLPRYGLKLAPHRALSAHLLITTTSTNNEQIRNLSRTLARYGQSWSLLYAGPCGWIYTHGNPRARHCPWCAVTTLNTGPMNAFMRHHQSFVPELDARGARAIGRAIARTLAGVTPSGTLTAVPTERNGTIELERIRTRVHCEVCGRPELDREIRNATTLTRRHLSADLAENREQREQIEHYLKATRESEQGIWTGAFTEHVVRTIEGDPNQTTLHHVRRTMPVPPGTTHGRPSITSGKGTSHRQAVLGAIGETAETRAQDWEYAQSHGARWTSQTALRDEGADVISPADLHHFSAAQHRNRTPIGIWMRQPLHAPSAYGDTDKDRPMYWIQGRDLVTDTGVWLPAETAHRIDDPQSDPHSGGSPFLLSTNYGRAAAQTRIEALTKGILELIEQDARGWWWMLRRAGPRVPFKGWGNDWLDRIEDQYATANRRLTAFDITTSPEARTVLSISAPLTPNRDGGVDRTVTCATGLSILEALIGATTENVECLPSEIDAETLYGADLTAEEITSWRAIEWPGPAWLHGTQPSIKPRKKRSSRTPDPQSRFRKSLKAARNAGARRVIAVDLTRLGTLLKCVRVLAPGLRSGFLEKGPGRYDVPQPWFRAHDRPLGETELPRLGPVR